MPREYINNWLIRPDNAHSRTLKGRSNGLSGSSRTSSSGRPGGPIDNSRRTANYHKLAVKNSLALVIQILHYKVRLIQLVQKQNFSKELQSIQHVLKLNQHRLVKSHPLSLQIHIRSELAGFVIQTTIEIMRKQVAYMFLPIQLLLIVVMISNAILALVRVVVDA